MSKPTIQVPLTAEDLHNILEMCAHRSVSVVERDFLAEKIRAGLKLARQVEAEQAELKAQMRAVKELIK